jgi:DNA-binding NarL/FixJ family response regulator
MRSTIVTVALVEDEPDVRERFCRVIAADPRLELVYSCSTGSAMRSWLNHHSADVLLVDLGLPDLPGLDVIRWCRKTRPHCDIMVISIFGDAAHMVEAFEAGACGYLVKDGTEDELASHVLDLHAGGSPMSPIIARQLLSRWQEHTSNSNRVPLEVRPSTRNLAAEALSPREREVLQMVARGCTYQETSAYMKIAVTTVQTHVRNIYGKLDVHNKTEAVYEARHLGLLD